MRNLTWIVLFGGLVSGCVARVGDTQDSGSEGVADASVTVDAGVDDAGTVDSGTSDASVVIVEPELHIDAGTWTQLTWPPFARVPAYFRDPSGTDDGGALMTTVVPWREFSRPVMFDGGLYYFGGGHSGYSGNDIMRFDTVTTTWTQLSRPHVPPADDSTYYSGGSQRVYIDPATGAWEPFTVHNYARSTYLPGRGYAVMIRCPSATELSNRVTEVADQPYGLSIFDEVTKTWTCDPRSDAESIIVNTGSYDPDLGGLLGFGTRYDYTVFSKYREDAGWTSLKSFNMTVLGPHGISGQQALYIPPLHGHLVLLMPQASSLVASASFFDSQTQTLTPVTLPPALVRDVAVEGGLSAAWDSKRGDVVIFAKFGNISRVWVAHAGSWDFHLENARGPDFASVGAPNRTAVDYDAITDAFYFVQASGGDTTTGKWPAVAVWKYVR